MGVTVKKAILWRKEVENQTGVLAATLQPLAEAGADLHVVMGYRVPGSDNKAIIELHPVSNKKSKTAAQKAGLAPSSRSLPWQSKATTCPVSATLSPKQ